MAQKKKKRASAPPPPVRKAPPRPQVSRPSRAKAEKRDALRRRAVTVGLVVVALAAVTAFVVVDRRQDAELRDFLTAGSCDVDTETDPTSPAGQNHVPNPTYAVDPPAGGDHLVTPARGGVYQGATVPADGEVVHSLEHGYVVVWHQPGILAEQRETLDAFEREHDGDVLVVERASLPDPFAATAWGQRLICGDLEPDVLERFFDEHVGNGPEDVARG